MEAPETRPNWLSLAEPAELDDLMHRFGNFHDSCIREIHVATGHYVDQDLHMTVDWRTNVRMLVQRQFRNPSVIELKFDGVISMHLSPPPPNCASIIFKAAFFVRDGIYYWAESGLWKPDGAYDGKTNMDRRATRLLARRERLVRSSPEISLAERLTFSPLALTGDSAQSVIVLQVRYGVFG